MNHSDGIRYEMFLYAYLLIFRLFPHAICCNTLIFIICVIFITILLKLLHCDVDALETQFGKAGGLTTNWSTW